MLYGEPDRSLRVFLIDDHDLFREGLREALETESELRVVGEAAAGPGSVEKVVDADPDVVLVDLRLPGASGVDLTRSIVSTTSSRCIILTTELGSQDQLERASEAGAKAYLVKDTRFDALVDAIRNVAAGCDLLAARVSSRTAQ